VCTFRALQAQPRTQVLAVGRQDELRVWINKRGMLEAPMLKRTLVLFASRHVDDLSDDNEGQSVNMRIRHVQRRHDCP